MEYVQAENTDSERPQSVQAENTDSERPQSVQEANDYLDEALGIRPPKEGGEYVELGASAVVAPNGSASCVFRERTEEEYQHFAEVIERVVSDALRRDRQKDGAIVSPPRSDSRD